jgi:7,8-dihydropterin-6-yl-methyl-4-(beta-D-ribofuranosyl)aminobenzene 5'-phosphate synthase
MAIDYSPASVALSQTGPQAPRRQFFCYEVGRREFVCGGGASVLGLILATSKSPFGVTNDNFQGP